MESGMLIIKPFTEYENLLDSYYLHLVVINQEIKSDLDKDGLLPLMISMTLSRRRQGKEGTDPNRSAHNPSFLHTAICVLSVLLLIASPVAI